jgi:hypothetical protein
MSVLVVGGPWFGTEISMSVANSESSLEPVTMISEGSSLVLVPITTTQGASVTTAGVADVSITLVVPVVQAILVRVWISVAICSPSEVIGSIDLSIMAVESLNITWLIVTVAPDLIVLEPTIVSGWPIPSF